ncbi:YceH family protein [Pseudomonas sp. No.117]
MSPEATPAFAEAPLEAAELRVLGSLIEKQLTTPETYPLTLNALVLACNQKTSREPVLNLTPGEVGQGLRRLEERGLARLVMGSRADRWEQRLDKALELPPPQWVLCALLFLRGPQTLGELLSRSSRLHAFDDTEQVRHHLERLIARGLAIGLGRQPGQREERYLHLFGSAAEREAQVAQLGSTADGGGSVSGREGRLEALEARIVALEERLARLEEAAQRG